MGLEYGKMPGCCWRDLLFGSHLLSTGYDEFKSGKYVSLSLWNQPISLAQNRLLREARKEA